jgi:hypothetical protein
MVVLEGWYAKNDGGRLTSAAVEYLVLDRLCGITVDVPEAGMGSCTRHSLSVSAESAERPSLSQMQRCGDPSDKTESQS